MLLCKRLGSLTTVPLKKKVTLFFWKGQSADERRDYGVAFAVRNTLLKKIEPPTGGSSRLLTMRLMTETGSVTQ